MHLLRRAPADIFASRCLLSRALLSSLSRSCLPPGTEVTMLWEAASLRSSLSPHRRCALCGCTCRYTDPMLQNKVGETVFTRALKYGSIAFASWILQRGPFSQGATSLDGAGNRWGTCLGWMAPRTLCLACMHAAVLVCNHLFRILLIFWLTKHINFDTTRLFEFILYVTLILYMTQHRGYTCCVDLLH